MRGRGGHRWQRTVQSGDPMIRFSHLFCFPQLFLSRALWPDRDQLALRRSILFHILIASLRDDLGGCAVIFLFLSRQSSVWPLPHWPSFEAGCSGSAVQHNTKLWRLPLLLLSSLLKKPYSVTSEIERREITSFIPKKSAACEFLESQGDWQTWTKTH